VNLIAWSQSHNDGIAATVFTARLVCIARTMLSQDVGPFGCLSVGIVSKWLDISSNFLPPGRPKPLNLLTLNSSKTEFLLIGLKQQLSKIHDSSLTTTHSARNLGFMFDEHLTFSDQISVLSKSCYYHIRELRCIRPYLDFKTSSTIATSTVHSKLDYCNSLFHNLLNY